MTVKSQLPHLLWNSGSIEMYLAMSYCGWACRPWNVCMLVHFSHSIFVVPWTAARQASLSITNSKSLLKLMSIELLMPSNHLILSSLSPPAFNLFQNRVFFPVSQFFTAGGQSIGASASALSMNIQDWFPLGWTGLISL